MKLVLPILLIFSCAVFAEENASFSKVYALYKKDPGAAITKYRDKVITYSATATSICKAADVGKYQISLNKREGRIILDKKVVPEDLWDLMWKERQKKDSSYKIKFTGVWTTNRMNSMYFYKVESVSWTPPKEKKGKKKKKKK